MPKPYHVIGRPTPLIDSPEKVVGRARYVADLKLPGMLHAKVLRSPIAHARIRSIDAERARRLPGVKAVLTGADIPQVRWGFETLDQTALAMGKVRFIGEDVAAVAAVDEAAALDALEEIRVDYDPLPEVFSPEESLRPGAPALHDEHPDNCAWTFAVAYGNTESGLDRAAAVHEETYRTSLQHPGYTEPIGSLAEVEPGGKVTVWTSTQGVFFSRMRVALALGLSESRVRIIQPHVGGAFGGKWCDEPNAMLSALLSVETGRPVRLINSRLDEFQGGGRPRVPMRIRLKVAVDRQGRILAKVSDILADAGANVGWSSRIMEATAIRADSCYRNRVLSVRARLAYTNNPPTGAFRGFGIPQMVFAMDSCLDHLAESLGLDPAEIRLVNAVSSNEVSVHGWKIGSCALRTCIERATEAAGWAGRRRDRGREGGGGAGKRRRGLGLACAIHVSGSRRGPWDGATALIRLNPDGRAAILTGEGDIGQGTKTMLAQVCAETLGLKVSDVDVSAADTDLTPPAGEASASRLTMISGNTVRKAAGMLRERLDRAAGGLLEADPADLEAAGGVFSVKGASGRSAPMERVAAAAQEAQGGAPLVAFASYDAETEMPHPETGYGNVGMGYTFSAAVAEVEVDMETGGIDVRRVTTADDIGIAVNPLVTHAQSQGGLVQGLGFALYENLVMDNGRIVNGNFADYTLPKAEGTPAIRTITVESDEKLGPFGAKAAAETSIDPAAAAVANAVYDATGVRITSLPITPEKLRTEFRREEPAAAKPPDRPAPKREGT